MGMKANSKNFKGTKGEKKYTELINEGSPKKIKRIPIEKKFNSIDEFIQNKKKFINV